jgi:hypothetical protein
VRRRLSTRLAATLWLALVILWAALSAPAQTPGKVPHVGYLWLGAEASDRATRHCQENGLLDRRGSG